MGEIYIILLDFKKLKEEVASEQGTVVLQFNSMHNDKIRLRCGCLCRTVRLGVRQGMAEGDGTVHLHGGGGPGWDRLWLHV